MGESSIKRILFEYGDKKHTLLCKLWTVSGSYISTEGTSFSVEEDT